MLVFYSLTFDERLKGSGSSGGASGGGLSCMLQLGLQGLGHFGLGLGLLYVDGEEALYVGLLQSDVVALDEAALVDLAGTTNHKNVL